MIQRLWRVVDELATRRGGLLFFSRRGSLRTIVGGRNDITIKYRAEQAKGTLCITVVFVCMILSLPPC